MIKLTSCKLVTGLLLLLAAIVVHAQMGLDIDLNRTVYMQYEPVYACISLRNDSGRALVFGNDPRLQGFILFEIRDANGRLVPKRPGAEISVTGLVLGPGEVKRMVLPVNKYYDIDPVGGLTTGAAPWGSPISQGKIPARRFPAPTRSVRWSKGATATTT